MDETLSTERMGEKKPEGRRAPYGGEEEEFQARSYVLFCRGKRGTGKGSKKGSSPLLRGKKKRRQLSMIVE